MNVNGLFFYLPALILLVLSGCAGTGTHENTLPVHLNDSAQVFPAGYEVQAIVQISRGLVREDYVLAMRTRTDAFSAAFLTPQGIPVYSVHALSGQRVLSRQTAIGELLNPNELLGYLELIYLEESTISKAIRNSWRWDAYSDTRYFYPVDAPVSAMAAIRIRYRGAAPWFSRIDLADKRNNTQIHVEVVEANRVLPE